MKYNNQQQFNDQVSDLQPFFLFYFIFLICFREQQEEVAARRHNHIVEIKTINNNSRDLNSNIITKTKIVIPRNKNSFTILTINSPNPTLANPKISKLKKNNWSILRQFKICQKNRKREVTRKLMKNFRMKRKRKKVRLLMKSKLTR